MNNVPLDSSAAVPEPYRLAMTSGSVPTADDLLKGWPDSRLPVRKALMALVQDGKIRPTVAEQITLEAIPKALERLAEAK